MKETNDLKLEEIKECLKLCKSVKVEMDEDNDIRLKIVRFRGDVCSCATTAQADYLKSMDNYIGTMANRRYRMVHKRVMSTIIDTVKKYPDIYFYLNV